MNMTIEEIREASADQLAMERQESKGVKETTPTTITPAVGAFAHSLNADAAQFLPVINDPYGLYGWCSDGVRDKITHDGGRPVFGWTIWEWPNVLLTAEFHCIWEDANGDRFDITPKPRYESQILFVADPAYPDDFDFDLRPRNRRTRLYVAPDRVAEAAALSARLTEGQRRYEEKRAQKAGLSLDDWLVSKMPTDTTGPLIDDLITACNEFEEHFDSLGTAGTVKVDEKFAELAMRRLQLQRQLKRQLPGS
ncbi:hypothetical protein [Sphingopyxis sp. GC21]|uniref:hypothetical protein n=1 Tax=Sphingopyxis sp. GC21 TaxID=2933562 RepID=UPI0021E4C159|nr:hypothetical protein [Sphingopyxis sp. GC21]